jgi:clan AA aspartic protease (TIGR02281 family)
MAANRLFLMLLSGILWMFACTSTPAASDLGHRAADPKGEASAFFANLASTSNNPLIVSMARESLQKMQEPASTKTTHEIKLLPQLDNTFVVPAMVNNKHTGTFLVDTGASYTVITPKMAKELGIRLDGSSSVEVNTANGTVHAPLVKIKQLSLGGLQVENVEAVVADLGDVNPISGLLGMSFFHGMELSFKQDKLVITH